MPTNINPSDIAQIRDLPTLLEFLRDRLNWEIEFEARVDELTFDYTADELNLSDKVSNRLQGGVVRQLQNFKPDQPWGIFLVEFNQPKLYREALRQVLRSLVPKQRQASDRPAWQHENLLFICATKDYQQFTFAHFRGQYVARATLATFGWQQGDTHVRTLCEFNLPALRFPADPSPENWLKQWRTAFDIEAVTDKFFADYHEVFKYVEAQVTQGISDAEQRRLYTQRLFNRLMFLYFIQKKGWLNYEGRSDYLRALFQAAEQAGDDFLNQRLYYLFFHGMSNAADSIEANSSEDLIKRRGNVPYLNGGLFDLEDEYDVRDRVKIPNEAFARVLALFERYNFTVTESTPLDVQVAVDPEMLGKVFEELVTGRHESGSYYTPRPVVSFMCREALKHYLRQALGCGTGSGSDRVVSASQTTTDPVATAPGTVTPPPADAIALFVDEENASGLSDPEKVLAALQRIRVCDPACGSGAYLLGMLQELMRLRAALFKASKLDDASLYARKRSIIENNLYGVDKDKFAVQIACLRLWLSLTIESPTPQPLPNLDFKIGCGDSLIAPAPNAAENLLDLSRGKLVNIYRELKGAFVRCNDVEQKRQLRQQIEETRAEIASSLHHQPKRPSPQKLLMYQQEIAKLTQQLTQQAEQSDQAEKLQAQRDKLARQLAQWQQTPVEQEAGFDWAVEFAEVFSPETTDAQRWDNAFPFMNDAGQMMFTTPEVMDEGGGFDVVLANPPYVRMELFKEIKPILKRNFASVHSERADLYVYFYDRAQQLLKQGGVSCFISSNKWLRAGYGENLRQALLDKQAFHLIVDFGDLPIFKASAYPAIFIWQKQLRIETPTEWAIIEDLDACYNEGLRSHVNRIGYFVPPSQFGEGKPRLTVSRSADIRFKMESSGIRLCDFVNNQFFYGVKTGLNEAFIINRETKEQLITEDSKSNEVIKELLVGNDVRKYETHFRESYLMYLQRGIDPTRYPAVIRYLKPYKAKLESRATKQEWYELQQSQAAYAKSFGLPKIIYPDIGRDLRFAMETKGRYGNDTTFMLPKHDWYLLGVINSASALWYLTTIVAAIRGGYLRFKSQYLETLPIPDAPAAERAAIAQLAQQTQMLHTQRRQCIEQFLRDLGLAPANSNSRNPLEQPWTLEPEEFQRRAKKLGHREPPLPLYAAARDEAATLTAKITRIERDLDERVAALYGVPLDSPNTPPSLDKEQGRPPFA